ncbi:hypothetical protein [Luteibacter yeojuensis]|uniref:Uncharacterized protein n=1 Tax=Luteibacter yeojuensis TaxID=345309 RepID=A0A0F3KC08_9GAMM|nr:hypothetical protein [Luteibacter yeojuensis]KJV28743.1 hypothetical protein VI08_16630 [Luteibacter yeojuensis]
MDQNILDVVTSLTFADIKGWLQTQGFLMEGAFGQYAALFRSFENEDRASDVALVVPVNRDVADYGRRMSELMSELAKLQDREIQSVLADLSLSPYDVVRVRTPHADSAGAVSLDAGIGICENAKAVLSSAANFAASPEKRKSWTGRKYGDATEYLSRVKFGQTQKGSFVLNLLSPWAFTPNANSLLPDDAPYGRAVMTSLADAMLATKDALSGVSAVERLVQSYAKGVSANFCQALSAIAEQGDGVDLSIQWAARRPLQTRPFLKVSMADAATLTDAARELRAAEPESDVCLEGIFTGIETDVDSFDGKATLLTRYGTSTRKILMEFSNEQRNKIYDAAKKKLWVRVTGELKAESRRYILLNPRDFEIVQTDELL